MVNTDVNKPEQVDAYLAELKHPFKAQVELIRDAIKGVSKKITEQVKWNAPSFSYRGYMMTFNLRDTKRLHLVWHNGIILTDPDGLLEGDYPDRRMTYFTSAADVEAKLPALKQLVHKWVDAMDSA